MNVDTNVLVMIPHCRYQRDNDKVWQFQDIPSLRQDARQWAEGYI
jgi:hypothetical protein